MYFLVVIEVSHIMKQTLLPKTLGTNFLTLPIKILFKSEIINWYLDNISFLYSILSGDK